LAKLTVALQLTDSQKTQAKGIFQDARQSTQPIRQQLQQERLSIRAAIEAGKSPQEVQQMASAEGNELAQLAGIRAATMAKFHAILTPDQQAKLTALQQTHGHSAGNKNETGSENEALQRDVVTPGADSSPSRIFLTLFN
jgi:Spy/CpxP family protein refolding chaperone